jgi:alkanesulfonate monooxygenase SsuD/methylene tetrahydromethanopterin reductase-like flavin-dependent oxidoreductase (luciferase family)
MEFGIFNLMGSRDPEKPTVEVFAEVAEQTRLADDLGYAIAWFAEHHFSNYCLCASPLMLVAHCASITKKIRLGTAVVVLPLYNPARLAAEIATADALSNGRLMLGVGAGYQPYEFERLFASRNILHAGRCPAPLQRATAEACIAAGAHPECPELKTSAPLVA